MTKGIITGASTRPAEYTVRLEFDLTQAQQISDKLRQKLIGLVQPILDAEVALIDLQNQLETKANQVNQAISDAKALETEETGPLPPESELVSQLLKELARLNAETVSKKADLARAKLERAIAARAKTSIDNAMAADSFSATAMFCADYSLDLEAGAEVGVCLIPGENSGATLTIYPAYQSESNDDPGLGAAWTAGKFGQLVPPYSMTPEACFYNWAMMPGWQRWMPTFRHATITAIDKTANTADVEVDIARSTVTKFVSGVGSRGLNVNETAVQPYRMENIEIQYMDCDCDAFRVGDRVIVEFTERIVRENKIYQTEDGRVIPVEEIATPAWQEGNSKIIGFIDGPRVCPIVVESGFVDYRDIDDETAGLLYPTESVFDGESDSPSFLDGDITEDPDDFVRDYQSGIDSISAPAGGVGAAKAEGLNDTNPTYCTGKLRLAVQAQYGSTSESQSLLAHSRQNKITETYALHTTSDDEYFLLTIRSGTVAAQKLKLPDPNQYAKIYEKLQSGGLDRTKAETYLLSRAVIDSGIAVSSASFDACDGAPIGGDSSYGWSANWSGDNAVIVTTETVYPGEGLLPLYQTQRLYKLDITISKTTETSYAVSASNDLLKQVNCTPQNNRTIIWYPNRFVGVMQAHIWTPVSGYAGDLIDEEEAPLFAFYAHYGESEGGEPEDHLIVFYHYLKTEQSDAETALELAQLRSDWLAGQTICGLGDDSISGQNQWALDYETEAVRVCIDDEIIADVPENFFNASQVYSVDFSLSLVERESDEFNPGAKPGFSGTSTPGYCGALVDASWRDTKYRTTVYASDRILYRASSDAGVYSSDTILIIPYIGADACYLGTLQDIGQLNSIDHASRDVVSRFESTLTGAVNASIFNALGQGGSAGAGVASGATTNLEGNGDNKYERSIALSFALYSRGGEQAPVTIDFSASAVVSPGSGAQTNVSNSILSALGKWPTWFDPPLFVDPLNERLLLVQESAGHNTIIFTDDPTQPFADETRVSDDELPEDLGPVDNGPFVGWA